MTASLGPFDEVAPSYDAMFTTTAIGSFMRRAVWRNVDARFRSGDRIFELNCGTGEDALHLAQRGVHVVATDGSPAMLEVARAKIADAGLDELVEFRLLALEECSREHAVALKAECGMPRGFDGVFSNFGGLNCVADLDRFGTALGAYVRPSAFALLCVMGPMVPWEWLWFLARGRPGRAFRRLRRGGVVWRGATIRYPPIRALRRALAPAFRAVRVSGIGALLPPPYTESLVGRFPRLLARLDRWERRFETAPPLPRLADHYLLELQRV